MTELPTKYSRESKRRIVPFLVGLLALSMMVWVIHKNGGVQTIVSVVHRLSRTWPLLLLPYVINALVTIMAYRTCLPGRGKAVPFRLLIQIERSGSALNAVLPLGDASSNVAKLALLRHWYTTDELVAAGVWGSLGTGLGNFLAAAGTLVAWLCFDVPAWAALCMTAVSFAAGVPATTALLLVRKGLSRRVAALLTKLPAGFVQRRRERVIAWAQQLDTHLAAAVGPRRGDFRRLVGWKLLYQTVRIAQVWLAIALLGLPGGIAAALMYNGMSRAIQQLLAFIPGRLGVLEYGATLLFDAMALPRNFGVQVALTLRFLYVVNLVLAGSALSGVHVLAQRYPPRSPEELFKLRALAERAHP